MHCSVDTTTVPAKKGGGVVGFDGYDGIKGTKASFAAIEGRSSPFPFMRLQVNINDSKLYVTTVKGVKIR